MNSFWTLLSFLLLMAIFGGFTGCSSLLTLESRMDMAVTRIAERKPHEYEGRMVSAKMFGAITTIQFDDGSIWHVDQAPMGLQPGDILRIYRFHKGLRAHLWDRPKPIDVATAPKS